MKKRKFCAPLLKSGDQPHATQPVAADQPGGLEKKKPLLLKKLSPVLQKTALPKVAFAKEPEKTQKAPEKKVEQPKSNQEDTLISQRRIYRLPTLTRLPDLAQTGLDPTMPPYSSVMSKLPCMAVIRDGLMPLPSASLGNLHALAEAIQDEILQGYIEHTSSRSRTLGTVDILLAHITSLGRMALETLNNCSSELPATVSAPFLGSSLPAPSVLPATKGGVSGESLSKAASVATAVSSAVWVPTPHTLDERNITRQLTESTHVPLSLLKALIFPHTSE